MKNMPIVKVLPDLEEESFDTPKQFTNIDKEDFEFTWRGNDNTDIKYVVKAGETKTYPKYLVNYAATHLTNKVLKREAFAAITDEKERKMGIVNWKDETKAKELSAKMVAKNYEKKEEEFKCPTCGKTFETSSKLQGHKLGAKH